MEFNISELQMINRALFLLREDCIKNYEDDKKYSSLTDKELLERKYMLFKNIMKLEDIQEKINNYLNFNRC